jgi:hypothetical protein
MAELPSWPPLERIDRIEVFSAQNEPLAVLSVDDGLCH